jgi:hypothetical protein
MNSSRSYELLLSASFNRGVPQRPMLVGGFCALDNLVHVEGGTAVEVTVAFAVARQAA